MLSEVEKNNRIHKLNDGIRRLNNRKFEYQKVTREIYEALTDFEDMKKGIEKAQMYLREAGTNENISRKIIEMDDDIVEIKAVIESLNEMEKETEQEIRWIDNKIMQIESEIRVLNASR